MGRLSGSFTPVRSSGAVQVMAMSLGDCGQIRKKRLLLTSISGVAPCGCAEIGLMHVPEIGNTSRVM